MSVELELPESLSSLFLAIGEEAKEMVERPVFTGDIFLLEDSKRVVVLQHPCSFSSGPVLREKILVGEVKPSMKPSEKDWKRSFRFMYFPDLNEVSYSVQFEDLEVLTSDALKPEARECVLSLYGVNILLQRWINQNARLVVGTSKLNEVTSDVFEETDLKYEAALELSSRGVKPDEAWAKVDAWLNEKSDGEVVRRQYLKNPQHWGPLRRDLRDLLAGDSWG